jgi:predicted DNA-binding antitoxin AbrB/MazE fold protein
MTIEIDAIYDNGVFRPLIPPIIPAGTRVHLRVEDANGTSPSTTGFPTVGNERAELDEFRRLMGELPIEGPNDGFSGADHDRLLYGNPRIQ